MSFFSHRACLVAVVLFGCSRATEQTTSAGALENASEFLTPDQIFDSLGAVRGLEKGDSFDASLDDLIVNESDLDEPDNHFDPEGPSAIGVKSAAPNASADLRAGSTVINQTNEGSCTAYAVAGAMQILAKRKRQRDDMSAQHLWFLQGRRPNLATSINTATGHDLAPLSVWPNGGYVQPVAVAPDNVERLHGFARLTAGPAIRAGLDSVRDTLDAGKPVIAASTLNDSWRYARSNGVIDPTIGKTGSWVHAAHAYGIVGYRNDPRFEDGGYFIVKNSWGARWGDHGYAYVPYSFCRYEISRRGYCIFYRAEDVTIHGGGATPTPEPDPAPVTAGYSVTVSYGAESGGYKSFSLRLTGTSEELARVDHVRFDVHPTFGSSASVTVDAANAFTTPTYQTYARDWQTGGATVYLRAGGTVALSGSRIQW